MFYWVTYSTSWHTWATMGAQQKKHSTRQRPEIFGVLSSPWYQWSPTSWSLVVKKYIFGMVSCPRWTPWLGLLVANHHWFLLIWFFLPLLCFLIWLFRMHTCFDVKRWSVIIAQSLSMNRSDMIYIMIETSLYHHIVTWFISATISSAGKSLTRPGSTSKTIEQTNGSTVTWSRYWSKTVTWDIEAKQPTVYRFDNEYFWQCIVPDGPINTNQNLNAKSST